MIGGVEFKNLRKTFTFSQGWGFKRIYKEIVAVDDISLSVPKGEAVAFIGPNGAGKSTTIKILTGILHPTSGEARVLGLTPWLERHQLARRIGVVFGQRSQLWYHLPPRDTFDLLARIYSLSNCDYRRQRDFLVERFDLEPFFKIPVRKLSLGQRMRAEIAASLLHRPEILFLDEPTIGLDIIARQKLRDLIREWNSEEGITIFLTSHDVGDIERVANQVVVINHGRIVLSEQVAAVRQHYLRSKILSVRFRTPLGKIELSSVSIIESSEYALKLRVDTNAIPIERVVNQILESGKVADISIEDPPLEEVIAHIYNHM